MKSGVAVKDFGGVHGGHSGVRVPERRGGGCIQSQDMEWD
jgi:hypothetical protein